MARTGSKQYPIFGWQGLLAVLVGLFLMFACGDPIYVWLNDHPYKAKWTKAQTEMGEIQKALLEYSKNHAGRYPARLEALERDYFTSGVPRDPFTNESYDYELTATGFRLTCLGKGQAVGGDELPDNDIVYDQAGLVGE